jgi:hypothetical protein
MAAEPVPVADGVKPTSRVAEPPAGTVIGSVE